METYSHPQWNILLGEVFDTPGKHMLHYWVEWPEVGFCKSTSIEIDASIADRDDCQEVYQATLKPMEDYVHKALNKHLGNDTPFNSQRYAIPNNNGG